MMPHRPEAPLLIVPYRRSRLIARSVCVSIASCNDLQSICVGTAALSTKAVPAREISATGYSRGTTASSTAAGRSHRELTLL